MSRPDATYESLQAEEFNHDSKFQGLQQPYEGILTDPFFMADSWAILNAQEERVEEAVIPNLEQFEGIWHPNGFIVVQLGTNPKHGALRLHIWPADLRHERSEKPGIHDHAWHLASIGLRGTYREEYYDLTKVSDISEEERIAIGALRSFQVGYNPGHPDQLAFDGNIFTATAIKEDTMEKGGIHWIMAKDFHNTTIPESECVATLALDSRPMGFSPHVLLDTGVDSLQSDRLVATHDELAIVREQLTA